MQAQLILTTTPVSKGTPQKEALPQKKAAKAEKKETSPTEAPVPETENKETSSASPKKSAKKKKKPKVLREEWIDAAISHEELDMMRQCFAVCDRDHKKSIDCDNLEFICKVLGHKMSGNACLRLLRSFDQDGDGQVNFRDFVTMLRVTHGKVFHLFHLRFTPLVEKILGPTGFDSVPPFFKAVASNFPGTAGENDFIDTLYKKIKPLGFVRGSCIPCVSLSRDELCDPLVGLLREKYDRAFVLSSVAGLLLCGTTGLKAAHAHSPVQRGRERYLYVAMPHIAVDALGNIGTVMRPGRKKPLHACGSLSAFKADIDSGRVDVRLDPDDMEQSILKQRLSSALPYGHKPSLVELTKMMEKLILSDLERLISKTVDTNNADYVVVTGVQVHGPHWFGEESVDSDDYKLYGDDMDHIAPGRAYAVINGVKRDIPGFYPHLTTAKAQRAQTSLFQSAPKAEAEPEPPMTVEDMARSSLGDVALSSVAGGALKKKVVEAGVSFVQKIVLAEGETVEWFFKSDEEADIDFSVTKLVNTVDKAGKRVSTKRYQKQPARCVSSKGGYTAKGPCTLVAKWDNSFSWFRSKAVNYYFGKAAAVAEGSASE